MNTIPLAERMRPQKLEDYIGQEHICGENAPLAQMLKGGIVPNMILWGPPGIGKTSLANVMSHISGRPFISLSAISSGVKDVREAIENAKQLQFHHGKPPILFIDEIHRFSKSQQDSLLGASEKGTFVLVGATTENPSFEINAALLSRCQVYVLKAFSKEDLIKLVERALNTDEIFAQLTIDIQEWEALITYSTGDARKMLNNLELLIHSLGTEPYIITNEIVENHLPQQLLRHDKKGDSHYDLASALIKSIRGSDVDASLFYLAKLLAGGEDIKFIARRLIISAAEDVGLANPNALLMANQCFQACINVGMPEARIILSECVVYLAAAGKSNSSYLAIDKALDFVKKNPHLEVPLHLRNAPTELMRELNYGQKYKYPHDYKYNYVAQEYLPEPIKGQRFFQFSVNATEMKMQQSLDLRKKK